MIRNSPPRWRLSGLSFSARIAEICYQQARETRKTSSAANVAAPKTRVGFARQLTVRYTMLTLCEIDTGSKTIITQTKPSDFPSHLRQKLQSNVQAVERHKIQTEAIAHERCPNCGREEVKYTSVQMRGADEGSTNIYNCDCGYSYVEPYYFGFKVEAANNLLDGTRTTERDSNCIYMTSNS